MTESEALELFPVPMQRAIAAVLVLEARGVNRPEAIRRAAGASVYGPSEVADACRMYRQAINDKER